MSEIQMAIKLLKKQSLTVDESKAAIQTYLDTHKELTTKVHPYGFYVIVMSKDEDGNQLRLHLYPKTFISDTRVHKHDWNLYSMVLVGSLINKTWHVKNKSDSGHYHYKVTTENNISTSILLPQRVTPILQSAERIESGDNYAMAHNAYHTISTSGFTATLLYQEKIPGGEIRSIDNEPFQKDDLNLTLKPVTNGALNIALKELFRRLKWN